MNIRIKYNGKFIKVLVSRKECPTFECFVPHKYQHHGQTIDSKSNDWQDKHWSCANNNYHGCPDIPRIKK